MIARIVSLLQKRKPDAPADWLKKLPDIAKRLEDSLYRAAHSLDEYTDFTTLKKRLQELAIRMGARAASSNKGGITDPQQAARQAQVSDYNKWNILSRSAP